MITSLVSTYVTPVLAGLAIAGFLATGVQTLRLSNLQRDVAESTAKATEKARERENEWGLIVRNINEQRDNEKELLVVERDRLIDELRKRPARRLPPTSSCSSDGTGATGKQLSQPDAEFLVRESSRYDAVAADLRACQAWVKAVTAK